VRAIQINLTAAFAIFRLHADIRRREEILEDWGLQR